MNRRIIVVALLWMTFAASIAVAKESTSLSQPANRGGAPHRSLSVIKLDIHDALRAEASTRRSGANAPDVLRLIELYREMAAHPKRDNSDVLAQMGRQVRSRLEKVRDHIQRHTTRAARKQKISIPPASSMPQSHVLAQQIPAPVGGAPAPGAQAAATSPGGTQTIDYGPELVDLIQRTISPATWDINGGVGSVAYYSQARVLVVSAPATVHGQVGNVLGQLRAAP